MRNHIPAILVTLVTLAILGGIIYTAIKDRRHRSSSGGSGSGSGSSSIPPRDQRPQ